MPGYLPYLLALLLSLAPMFAAAQPVDAYPVDLDDLAEAHPAPGVTIPPGYALVASPAADALPATPAYVVPRGFALVPAASLAAAGEFEEALPAGEAPEAWWKPLIRNADTWAMVFTMIMGIWGYFHKKSRDDFKEAFREVVSIAYHATEEDYSLGTLTKGDKGGRFIEEVTAGLTGRGFAKRAATPATLAMAKAAAKALNAPSPTSMAVKEPKEPAEDPTPARS